MNYCINCAFAVDHYSHMKYSDCHRDLMKCSHIDLQHPVTGQVRVCVDIRVSGVPCEFYKDKQ